MTIGPVPSQCKAASRSVRVHGLVCHDESDHVSKLKLGSLLETEALPKILRSFIMKRASALALECKRLAVKLL